MAKEKDKPEDKPEDKSDDKPEDKPVPDVPMDDEQSEAFRKDALKALETLNTSLLKIVPSLDGQREDLRNVLGFMAERPKLTVDELLASYKKEGPRLNTRTRKYEAVGGFFGRAMADVLGRLGKRE